MASHPLDHARGAKVPAHIAIRTMVVACVETVGSGIPGGTADSGVKGSGGAVALEDGSTVGVRLGVALGVREGVAVNVAVAVGAAAGVSVEVGVGVGDGVAVWAVLTSRVPSRTAAISR